MTTLEQAGKDDQSLIDECNVTDLGQRVRIKPSGKEGVAEEFDLEGGAIYVRFDDGSSRWYDIRVVELAP